MMLLSDQSMHVSAPDILAKLAERYPAVTRVPGSEDRVERPDYDAWAKEVQGYADSLLPHFVGEAREEVQAIFDDMHSEMAFTDVLARHKSAREYHHVRAFAMMCDDDTLSVLRDYGIDETIVARLEDMGCKAARWAQTLQRQRGVSRGCSASQ
jgi:hypothetical protein